MTTIFSLLIGAVLGTRYKVFCLPPVILAAALFIAALDHLHEVPPGSTALTALAAGVGLQIGYLAGAMIHALLFASPADAVSAAAGARDRSASMS
ncbi:hypothetical protein [Bradyrhizobium sp.]|uniref:hypothetical protein n=1 Tax=Bradyrhizobium sp. TaxID=376 RepID=UPI001DA92050|nr:hypothetical protein [Bradyrhizobium sp.]MBV8696536.1 hypothetical protein [Bradyrhizobium sp.]MBV8919369.1 hypothetical protein [Bradyrhizobium sp.]MBV9979792.1 hypothetical protein [Bradyrhizobium sp.]